LLVLPRRPAPAVGPLACRWLDQTALDWPRRAEAKAAKRERWTVTSAGLSYELRRKSRWRSAMELVGSQGAVGSIRREARRELLCELPAEVSPAAQAFVGFVVLTLWDREAASSGADGAGAVAASGA
jgi:hypothetical protein